MFESDLAWSLMILVTGLFTVAFGHFLDAPLGHRLIEKSKIPYMFVESLRQRLLFGWLFLGAGLLWTAQNILL